jgi:hypothetical protein
MTPKFKQESLTMKKRYFWIAILGVFLFGCDLDDVPRFSSDGKKIAILIPSQSSRTDRSDQHQDVAIVDIATGDFKTRALPEAWSAAGLIWIENDLLIRAVRKINTTESSEPKFEVSYWRSDIKSENQNDLFFNRVDQLTNTNPFEPPFIGLFNKKPSIYVPWLENETEKVKIFSLDLRTELGSLPYEFTELRNGWTMRMVSHELKNSPPQQNLWVNSGSGRSPS